MKKPSLLVSHPELCLEWHYNKNETTTPGQLSSGSNKKVWWQCSKGSDHEWQASPNGRTKASGCPFCGNRRLSKSNSLEICFPSLAKQWHYTKNLPLTPDTVIAGGKTKYWWQCDVSSDHTWVAHISNRKNGKGCPICAGQKVIPTTSFLAKFPKLAEKWHKTLNGNLFPNKVAPFTHEKVWWQCDRFTEHVWRASVSTLSKGHGCPHCSPQTSEPEIRILSEMMYLFDNVTSRHKVDKHEVDIFLADAKVAIEYDGFYYHKGKVEYDRYKIKHLKARGIELIRVRVSPLKKLSAHDIIIQSEPLSKRDIDSILASICRFIDESEPVRIYLNKKVFQNDSVHNKYMSYFPDPFPENSLHEKNKVLAEDWDFRRNYPLTPKNFTAGSGKVVWWRCKISRTHVWEQAINVRNKRGCPFCSGRRASETNNLQARYPNIAKELDDQRNIPEKSVDFSPFSNKHVWFKCSKNHSYKMSIAARTKGGQGCSSCASEELLASSLEAVYPEIALTWHPVNNGDKCPSEFQPKSQKKVWWSCDKNHEHSWEAVIASRVNGTGCPICSGRVSSAENNLHYDNPSLADEFDLIKNYPKKSYDFKSGSGKKVWWKCKLGGHNFEATIYSRAKMGTTCPQCKS